MNKFLAFFICFFICLPAWTCLAATSGATISIYLDADMTGANASGVSIERGIRTALSQVDNKLAGYSVEIRILDHRGNSARSLANLKTFLADPYAFVLFTGLHSPPLLAHRQFINENKILTLDPWAAAGPITRPPDDNNWIFRLSIDDSKAGGVIVRRAVDERGFISPALLLENTGWGKSNQKTMTANLSDRGIEPARIVWFDWGLTETSARIMLRNIKASGADVIFLVANAPEGKNVCRAMCELPPSERLPIVSHWGITGGDFPEVITAYIRDKIDLEFIQTSFSFLNMGDAPFPNTVFQRAASLFQDVKTPKDIKASTGFIHAYDLTRLLIAAVKQAGMSKNMLENRTRVRAALENLKKPVQGLIKIYERPFKPYSISDKDAHEALGTDDFTFGRYGENNEVILIRQ